MIFYDESLKILISFNEDETSNYQEAKDNPMWMKAMKEEIDSIEKNGMWKLVPKLSHTTIIGLKWMFKVKRDVNGSISKHKAKLLQKDIYKNHALTLKRYLHQLHTSRLYEY